MATKTYGLTTEARVKTRVDITANTYDAVIKSIIYAVTDFIEKSTNRRFQRTTYSNEIYDGCLFDGSRKGYLVLKNSPVISISSFQYRTGAKSNPSWVDFNSDNYQEINSNGIIQTDLPYGLQNIRISYVAGYLIDFSNMYDDTLHTLPFDISDLTERIVTRIFKKRISEGRSAEGFQQSQITWDNLLDDLDKEILANYRRVFIP